MDANEGQVPVRRSFVPGVAQEPPPAPVALPPQPDTGAPTEVFGAAVLPGLVELAAPAVLADPASAASAAVVPVAPAPWYRRTWVLVSAGAVLVVAVGTAIGLAMGGGQGTDSVANAPTGLPAVSQAPAPSAAPETLLDDGIADHEYPAKATSDGPGFPEAFTMEDWVWDKVGPTWALTFVGSGGQAGGPGSGGVAYLASPEGKLFHLATVSEEYGSVWLVSWNEGDLTARLEYAQPESSVQGAAINLQSGEIEQMSFTIDGAPSSSEVLLAASPDGHELWTSSDATNYAEVLQRWSPSEGWQPGPVSDDLAMWASTASANGCFVAVEVHDSTASGFASERSGPPGQPNLVVIDVATGQETLVRPVYGDSESWFYLSGITDEGVPVVGWYGDDYTQQALTLARDGATLEPIEAATFSLDVALNAGGQVVEPTAGLVLTATAGDYSAFEVAVAADGAQPVTVLRAGETLPFRGLQSPRVTIAAPDVALISDWRTCALVDTKFAVARVLVSTEQNLATSCVGFGLASR